MHDAIFMVFGMEDGVEHILASFYTEPRAVNYARAYSSRNPDEGVEVKRMTMENDQGHTTFLHSYLAGGELAPQHRRERSALRSRSRQSTSAGFLDCQPMTLPERVKEQERLSLTIAKLIISSQNSDGALGGWQGYLERHEITDDFKRFLRDWSRAESASLRRRQPMSTSDLCHYAQMIATWQFMLRPEDRIS